jgi:transposase-like protein
VLKSYLREFRDDVVRVARGRDPGVTVEQIAKDFGVHPMTLFKWLCRAEVEGGTRAGTTMGEAAELWEARRRVQLLGAENEVLRRAAQPAVAGRQRTTPPLDVATTAGIQGLTPTEYETTMTAPATKAA